MQQENLHSLNFFSFPFFIIILVSNISACQSAPLQSSSKGKSILVPFSERTEVTVLQGAFGQASHAEPGNEYNWDFGVPLGTPVLASESGTVLEVWQPEKGGTCEASYSDFAHNIKVEHIDGTVAQYVHIQTKLKPRDEVTRGQEIAVTAWNGWICEPHLHFGLYASKNELYYSPKRRTIPLNFTNLEGGIALEGARLRVMGKD
jgi:murein DD-endopeptidase MepM/ murein hydrolase activator NlpD